MAPLPAALVKALANPSACTKLSLAGAGLHSIPPEIGTLTALRTLNLWRAVAAGGDPTVPPEIGRLRSLETLSLGGNAFRELPDEIGRLGRLRKLELDYAGFLKSLPESIGTLGCLEELSLGYAESLTRLPKSLGGLPRLKKLLAYNSAVASVAPSLWETKTLETLWLPNGLDELPPGVGSLPRLRDLTLSSKALASISKEFPRMGALRRLKVQGEGAALPENLGELPGLRELEMSYLELETLPASLASLRFLEKLDVSGNPLRELKPLVLALPRLRELDFSDTRLKLAERREIDALLRKPAGKRGGVPVSVTAAGSASGINSSLVPLLGAPDELSSWAGAGYEGLLRKLGRKEHLRQGKSLAVALGVGKGVLQAFRAGETLVLVEGFYKPKDPLFVEYVSSLPEKAVRPGRLDLPDGVLAVLPATEDGSALGNAVGRAKKAGHAEVGDALLVAVQPGAWGVAVEPERKASWGAARRIILTRRGR